MKKSIRMLLVGLSLIGLNSCEKKYDCPDDYSGKLIVDKDGNDFLLKDSCKFISVSLPDFYKFKYEIGDSLGRPTMRERYQQKKDKFQQEYSEMIIARDKRMVETIQFLDSIE